MRMTNNKRQIMDALSQHDDDIDFIKQPCTATEIQSNLKLRGHNVPALGNLVTTLQLMREQGLLTETEGSIEYPMNRDYNDGPYWHQRDTKAYHVTGADISKPEFDPIEAAYSRERFLCFATGQPVPTFEEWKASTQQKTTLLESA